MSFTLERGGRVSPRAGRLVLPHGVIETPAFMPVGTRGTVKALDMADLWALRPGMILGNAFHLWSAPGEAAVAAAGGLHRWSGWQGNILTDSGGYQAVSLARVGRARVGEDGVEFDTPAGARLLSPEGAMAVQEMLAPDVMMALDQPVAFGAEAGEFIEATARTHRWALRCRDAWNRGRTELWGIVQGGFEVRARTASAEFTAALDLPGYAVGGLSLGEPGGSDDLLAACTEVLPQDRPRYLMGVGTEPEMLAAIRSGIDLFDCVWPTRLARTGAALVGPGRLNLLGQPSARDPGPVEPGCRCSTCSLHSRGQLHHLLRRGELLGFRLLTIHNLHHTLELARAARAAILVEEFEAFAASRLAVPGTGGAEEGLPI